MHLKCGGDVERQLKKLERNDENIGRKLVDGSSIVAGVAVRRDLGWGKLEVKR